MWDSCDPSQEAETLLNRATLVKQKFPSAARPRACAARRFSVILARLKRHTFSARHRRAMRQYHELLRHLLDHGVRQDAERTGTGTLAALGYQMRFDLQQGFPLVTTKKIHWKSVVHELLWFIRGDTNNRLLEEQGVTIWREWARPDGSLGPIYGKQWRRWEQVEMVAPRRFEPPAVQLKSGLVAGVGHGTERRNESDWNRHLYSVWNEMLHRCYDTTRQHYSEYGGQGVFVAERWHDFNNFLSDAPRLPNALLKRAYPDEYELDKDYYATNQYGPETCLWLTRKEQNINTRRAQVVEAQGPYTKPFWTMDVAGLCRDYGLDESSVYKCLRGEKEQHKGWKFRSVTVEGCVPRLRIFDQLKTVIAQLRHEPASRRIVLSAWNVGEVEHMALPPCHCFVQFHTLGGRLSCHLYQRSGDAFLGVPFNIASYSLLTLMVAQVCGLQPGEFIHTIGDAHLYVNHIEQARLQLTREPLSLPTVRLNPEVRSVFDFKFEDIELVNYQHHPPIKAAVAV
jgi:thymidylate synthase